jgi:uncharacterized protein (DUF608 family)
MAAQTRTYNGPYTADNLDHVAFPLGGIGAGMICLEGTGTLSHVSVRGQPNVFNEPMMFAALHVRGERPTALVLEGPVPRWKIFFPWDNLFGSAGNGGAGKTYGLPRHEHAEFRARFPFASVGLADDRLPVRTEITGWSPFIPGDSDNSSLPVAGLEYRFTNPTDHPVDAVFSYHAVNFLAAGEWTADRAWHGERGVGAAPGGFTLWQTAPEDKPWQQAALSICADDPAAKVNCAWFRGGWWDPITVAWKTVEDGAMPEAGPVEGDPSPGGSLYVPFRLEPGEEKVIRLRLAWYVPETDIRFGKDMPESGNGQHHKPWYAGQFPDHAAVTDYWRMHYDALRDASRGFADCFYDTTLPPEVVEAVAANLTILKSPTLLRQADGRLWAWEGCHDNRGCCPGSCTHVWNYAQALPHLFPNLERTLRETEFGPSQDDRGHQVFRSALPIRPIVHDFHAAADGQLGGIVKAYREWRISGDTAWLRGMWPAVKLSMNYCIDTWDPEGRGLLIEPHHNTYDIEFWGPDGMCTSFYLAALQAAVSMAEAVGDEPAPYRDLLAKGRAAMESELWDGEYFIQRIQWQGLRAPDPTEAGAYHTRYSPEARELLDAEGPKYQYGPGCLSDGVLGAWLGECSGVTSVLDRKKVTSHLVAVHRYNFRHDLSDYPNPQRPTYALGHEAGLLLCTWPKGGALTLPMVYSNEVWTGIEYQVASHLMMNGHVDEGLDIVRAVRDRYDGRVRNPFNEYECGHWYARAMASYALLQGLSGARYDAVDKVLYLKPSVSGDFRAFLSTATGYGTAGVHDGQPFLEVRAGTIDCQRIEYEPRD